MRDNHLLALGGAIGAEPLRDGAALFTARLALRSLDYLPEVCLHRPY